MTQIQSLVSLYEGIFNALRAQGKTTITRPEIFEYRQAVWPTWKGNGIADTKALTEAAKNCGLKELCDFGPKGKRTKVRFQA